jgi:chromosome condensin MukBEF complex kleisin-like MukF subunit
VCAEYSTGCHQEHKKVVDVLIHSNSWSSFITDIVRHVSLLDRKNSFSLEMNVEIKIFYTAISALNIDLHKNLKNSKNGNAFGHISHCVYKTTHTHTYTHTHTNIYTYM